MTSKIVLFVFFVSYMLFQSNRREALLYVLSWPIEK